MVISYIIQNAWEGIQGNLQENGLKIEAERQRESVILIKILLQIELSRRRFH